MIISRIYENLGQFLKQGKILIIFGPRQVGKTTLLNYYLSKSGFKSKLATGEDIGVQEVFESGDLKKLSVYAEGYQLLAIDEAQKIKNIGQSLKMLIDARPELKIIATGSSSFELAGQVGEPLTGRKITLNLFPVSQLEFKKVHNDFELRERLEEFLLYGGYPEVAAEPNLAEKKRLVMEIAGSYLLKDIIELDKVRSSKTILDLLRLLAWQIGSEVSYAEIGQQIGLNAKTVSRYLDLLEKAFVVYNLRGYSRNLRQEITRKSKYYFYDNGIRNAIIANFNPLSLRDDVGKLWENFLFSERLKKQVYQNISANNYFWRVWAGGEVDWVEEREGRIFGYEFKWSKDGVKAPKKWLAAYPKAEFKIINQDNYLEFVA